MAGMIDDEMVAAFADQIIRPPRAQYQIQHLGPTKFPVGNWMIERTDFTIKNKRDMTLQCSIFEPTPRPAEKLPCVMYLHGNASSRLEALSVAPLILTSGTTLLSVDLAGSGLSDGEYISLGYYEKDDVTCLVEYLKERNKTSKVALWGRSMGAATALLYLGENDNVDDFVKGAVVDSPFASLDELAHDIINTLPVPVLARKAIGAIGVKKADAIVQEKANFEINHLVPARAAKNCKPPVLMLHGKDDTFILPKHSEKCFQEYGGAEKRLILCEGTHDGERPQWALDHIYVFLQHLLIAGSVVNDTPIAPLSLAQVWKERGNELTKGGKWAEACEWYTRTIDFLLGEVKEGREKIRPQEDDADPGVMKKWFGFLYGPPQESPARAPPKATDTDRLLATLYSNNSLCFLKMGEKENALLASVNCLKHNPEFVRGYSRKATAHFELEQYEAAKLTADEGLMLDPANAALLEIKTKAMELCVPNSEEKAESDKKKDKKEKKEKKKGKEKE
eukprot:CAMPEP_0201507776 /NCGR_PEP_ID=MMETSP0161_2-20130828/1344_1 /ASSEMBLY_ACC=CAM_ASM_000251 /TAXON_ID=180227 /ORGANISM="Neoparamoeba aestuarina, Strain SoJaBio B1-5/56/2" /LENGTH=506 /DNA_ID=CAMNT_0047902241 /DNA_START=47 /DNA_END=1564 /DNA_ORIENTATION=-